VDGEDRQIINMFGYKLIGINAFTKYPATANELAKYLASEECQQQRAEELNWGPSNISVAESDLIKNDEAISAILAQSEYSVPQVRISATFWAPLKTFGNKIVDFDTPMTEASCKELLHTTISNIRDE
ncbi:MAG: extracellular solute-binding protein, partial [Clostridia bacterium]|nr:extracellular solute-binding protein [Clostridia bacterium]